jgi:hypothetical protein
MQVALQMKGLVFKCSDFSGGQRVLAWQKKDPGA